MEHLIYFMNSDVWFESLGIQVKLEDKFRDLKCNLLFLKSDQMLEFCAISNVSWPYDTLAT